MIDLKKVISDEISKITNIDLQEVEDFIENKVIMVIIHFHVLN